MKSFNLFYLLSSCCKTHKKKIVVLSQVVKNLIKSEI